MNELTLRQSEIACFLECRRRWYWEYVRGLVVDPPGFRKPNTSHTGTMVHKGVELYYRNHPLDEIRAGIREEGARLSTSEGSPALVLPEEWEKAIELALIMVEGYIADLAESGADRGRKTLFVEKPLQYTFKDIQGVDVTLTGIADLGVEADWGVGLEDTKTVSTIDRVLTHARQLRTYALLLRLMEGTVVDRISTNQIKRVKRTKSGPFFGRPWMPMNSHMYDATYDQVLEVLTQIVSVRQRILSGDLRPAYPVPGQYCSWKCSFEHVCIAQDDGSFSESMVEIGFQKKEGYA